MGTCMVGHVYVMGSHFTSTSNISYSHSHSHSHSRLCSHLVKVTQPPACNQCEVTTLCWGALCLVFVSWGPPHKLHSGVHSPHPMHVQMHILGPSSSSAAVGQPFHRCGRLVLHGPRLHVINKDGTTAVRRNGRPPGPLSRHRCPGPALRSLPDLRCSAHRREQPGEERAWDATTSSAVCGR
jgi:hypothetical protein